MAKLQLEAGLQSLLRQSHIHTQALLALSPSGLAPGEVRQTPEFSCLWTQILPIHPQVYLATSESLHRLIWGLHSNVLSVRATPVSQYTLPARLTLGLGWRVLLGP